MINKAKNIALLFLISINIGLGQSALNLKYSESDILLDKVYQVIQFNGPLLKADHANLEAQGLELIDHVGANTFLVSLPVHTELKTLEGLSIKSIAAVTSSIKSGNNLRSEGLPEWAIEGNMAKMLLRYPINLEQDYVKQLCAANKIEVVMGNGYNNQLEVRLPMKELDKAFSLPFVIGLESISPPSKPDDKLGRNLHRVNRISGTGGAMRNYTGEGVTVLVRDDGAVFEHIDFQGRMDNSSSGISRGDHGDGVAGLIAGAGNLDPNNQGMAYGSDMYVIDYVSSFLDETMDLVNNNGVLITNSSYSDGCNRGYSGNTRNVDQQMFQNPELLHVFSAGNDGESDCDYGAGPNWGNITGGHKIGKNVIAVANLNNLNVVESSSSRGPAFDGRIKPDIAANGFGHVSTIEAQGYEPFGGTSAAAPVVAGISSMMYQAYRDVHGETPKAGLIKAILLNTATDLGNKGPDFIFGWGSINAHKAATAIEEGRFLAGKIDQEQTIIHDIEIPANVKEVRIMTYWPDRNGTTSNEKHLINDLNSTLTLGTEEFLPWVLDPTPDPAKLDAPATKGFDNLNNMEQIAIDNPAPGNYQLKIKGDYIPFSTADYYVVWEFITDKIDITYPVGNENVITRDREVFHWDAVGDEGDFEVNVVRSNGDTLINRTIDGSRRFVSLTMPSNYYNDLKLIVSRNGVSAISDTTFIVSGQPLGLKTEREDNGATRLSWNGFAEAVSYNVYILGEKYMEIVGQSDSLSYVFPLEERFKIGWVAVSPNFADGREGKRTTAIPIRPAPLAQVSDDLGGRPCIDEIVVFSTESLDTLTEYLWNFGPYSDPEEAYTAGPHEVRYSRRGKKTGYLKVSHEGGSDAEFFEVNVQRLPEGGKVTIDALGFGEHNFTTDIKYVDSIIWDFGDGTLVVGDNPSHTYAADGFYTVTMTAKSVCGDIVVAQELGVATTTSTSDLDDQSISVRPNPNDGNFTIQLSNSKSMKATVALISIDGRKIQSNDISGPSIKYNDIAPGLYLLNYTVDGKRLVKKIIVN